MDDNDKMDDQNLQNTRDTMLGLTIPSAAPPTAPESTAIAPEWAELLAQAEIRGPYSPGVSFVHLQCDCSSPDTTRTVMRAIVDRSGLPGAHVLALPDRHAVEALGSPLPGMFLTTYADAASRLQRQAPPAVMVFDTHGGRHSFLLLMTVAWLIRKLAERCRSHREQTHANVFVLSPSSQRLWSPDALSRHFAACSLHSAKLVATFQRPPVPQQAPTTTDDDQVPDLEALLEAASVAMKHNVAESADLTASDAVFAACMLPLHACRQLWRRLVKTARGDVQVLLLTQHNLPEQRALLLRSIHERQPLHVLVDSSLRFPPAIRGPPHIGVLPREACTWQWDVCLGQVVSLPARVPIPEFNRLAAINPSKEADQAELYWAGPCTPGLKDVDCFPWSGDMLELVLCAVAGLQRGLPGAPECLWWCLRDVPVFPFDTQQAPWRPAWFDESVRQLCKWGLVTSPPQDPGADAASALDQQTLAVTGDWGSPAVELLMTGEAVTVHEAILVVALRREEDHAVRYAIAAIASLHRVGLRNMIHRGVGDTCPTFDQCLKLCTGTGAALASRGRLWLALGMLHRAKTATTPAHILDLSASNLEFVHSHVALAEHHMKAMLGPSSDAKFDTLSGGLSQGQLLRVEVALVRAMLPNLVIFACRDPAVTRTVISALEVKLEPFDWADDLTLPSSPAFGVHFGLQKKFRTARNDWQTADAGYTSDMMVQVSSDAVLQVFDDVLPAERHGGRRPEFFSLMRSYYRVM
ncbi:hypothetical protein QBC41DRAFT_337766 [Cercophora samala]|uniref:Uncharacterized protein n=1 Tax=Cercophora samala TaxID=330535 RepID=A0AA39ZCG5_9PEZI|nr:hypothetical protein QBC41DRAFT_337766 [Cercophora samala]